MPIKGLSEEVKLQIVLLLRQGLSMKATATKLGLTKGQVAGVKHRAGLSKKKFTEATSPGGRNIHSRSG